VSDMVPVSKYTRADGTKVRAYIRRAPGAAAGGGGLATTLAAFAAAVVLALTVHPTSQAAERTPLKPDPTITVYLDWGAAHPQP
jgi:hypothetical protein